MTAAAYQDVGTVSESAAAWPTHVAGDLGVLVGQHGSGTVTTPSGFSIVDGSPTAIVTGEALALWCKRAESNAEIPADITAGGALDHRSATVITFRNAHQVYPIHTIATKWVGGSTITKRLPGIKTLVDGCAYLAATQWVADQASNSATFNSPTGLTNGAKRSGQGTASGDGGGALVATGEIPAAGTVEIGSFSSANNEQYTSHVIAIAPIADIEISGTVARNGTAVSGGSVRLVDITQPAATYLVVNEDEEDAVATVASDGTFTLYVPYTDHEYIAVYTDTSGEVYGASQRLTYSSGFPSAEIELGGVSFPTLANASTLESIRDRIIALIAALTPTSLTGNKFRVSRDEGAADFRTFCESTPAGCLRRFQVDDDGTDEPPESNPVDYTLQRATFVIQVAYPNTHRYGGNAGRDRKDVIDEDWRKINFAIGVCGRGNFTGSYDCTPMGARKEVDKGDAVTYLVVTAEYTYYLDADA